MKFLLMCLIIFPIMGVLGKKNGYPLDRNGKTTECSGVNAIAPHYCNSECTKVYYAKSGYCCWGACYCFGLEDDKPIGPMKDITKKYCDVQIIPS
uniref:Insect excitatory neurotoxin precusor n=1 Tax=Hottentotta judaicus TaxID=6863 RepID=F0V3V8_HOTJU|nr:insect excitatory neurotoxin precusor [Hottentotta judaicus]